MSDQPLDVAFAVLDVAPEPYAVSPVLTARVGVAATGSDDEARCTPSRCAARSASSRCGVPTPTTKRPG